MEDDEENIDPAMANTFEDVEKGLSQILPGVNDGEAFKFLYRGMRINHDEIIGMKGDISEIKEDTGKIEDIKDALDELGDDQNSSNKKQVGIYIVILGGVLTFMKLLAFVGGFRWNGSNGFSEKEL